MTSLTRCMSRPIPQLRAQGHRDAPKGVCRRDGGRSLLVAGWTVPCEVALLFIEGEGGDVRDLQVATDLKRLAAAGLVAATREGLKKISVRWAATTNPLSGIAAGLVVPG